MKIDIVKIKELEKRVSGIRSKGSGGFYESIRITKDYVIQGGREFGIRDKLLQLDTLVKEESVLDFGCNMGGICIDSKRVGAKRVVGIEMSKPYIVEARELVKLLGLDIEYHCFNMNDMNLDIFYKTIGNEKFDVVFMLSIWRHIQFEKFFEWTNNIIKDVLVFEGHPCFANEKQTCFDMLNKYFNFKEIRYVGEADNCVGKTTGRPLFICRK